MDINLTITSIVFFACLPIVLSAYYYYKKHQSLILLLASWLLCLTWGLSFLIVIMIYSLINFMWAIKISEKLNQQNTKSWLWSGIVLNLSGLIFFKYFTMFEYGASRLIAYLDINYAIPDIMIAQPIGISFYVLQAISYLIDVYRGQIPANKNFIETSLYLAYFPKLIAGPIEQAGNFFKQLTSNMEVNNQQFIDAFTKIMVGLTQKIIIAETLLEAIPSKIFIEPIAFSSPELVLWWLCFTFVIYNDFAGYTNIALGISSLFGINLSANFQQPFFSTSFIDFWNRWHISLSNWLRNYVYLPLSRWMLHRNPNGKYIPNLIVPPLLTMIASGIWHGFAFHFILWGILHGALQGIERIQKSRKKIKGSSKPNQLIQTINAAIIFILIFFINILFKFNITQSLEIWHSLILWDNPEFTASINLMIKPLLAIGLSFLIDYFQIQNNNQEKITEAPRKFRIFVMAIIILLMFLATRQQVTTPFIYQEF